MDNYLKTDSGFATTLQLLETVNRSSDDFLFIWDIPADKRWFFGDIDKHYDIRPRGSDTNSTPEMLRIIHPADRAAVLKSLEQIAQGQKDSHDMNYRWINRNGEKVWINCHGTLIRDNEGNPHLMIGRVSEENLRHLFNPLTALWNKNKLLEDLKLRLAERSSYLLLLDIDSLATINLTHGREYGDQVLKEIAEICENLEMVHTAYHVDHNNFGLVLQSRSESDVKQVYDYLGKCMQGKCTFTASAVPVDKTIFLDESHLMDAVNMTLKRAKGISNNRLEFFSEEELNRRIASLELLEELKTAVINGCEGFEIHYQPQIRARSYEIYGAEALLRYNSPTRGRVFPDQFIPILEQSRLIYDVGLWVLEQALQQCKQWRNIIPEFHISVNFSALQFEDPALADKVIRRLRDAGLTGDALTVEITESMELQSSTQLKDTIRELKKWDINVAVDDFGTGYSNLSHLKQMTVDEIKIDRVFVSGIEKEDYNHKLVSNIIEFARSNDIRICCEGVESARELVILELLLPDLIQGYLFDRPRTPMEIERSYLDTEAKEYKDRLAFLKKIQELKAEMGMVHFDHRGILKENEVGLWIIRYDQERDVAEAHIDETMEVILGLERNEYTPQECFNCWYHRIHPDHKQKAESCMEEMLLGKKAVQTEFIWCHPQKGDICLRISGKRVKQGDGTMVLEGYCRSIDDIKRI